MPASSSSLLRRTNAEVAQTSKSAVSPTSQSAGRRVRQSIERPYRCRELGGICGFGNPRHSRLGSLRYPLTTRPSLFGPSAFGLLSAFDLRVSDFVHALHSHHVPPLRLTSHQHRPPPHPRPRPLPCGAGPEVHVSAGGPGRARLCAGRLGPAGTPQANRGI